MTHAAEVAARYIAVWNERDPSRRKALLAESWTEDAEYVDPMMGGKGAGEIGALIGAVHERFPGFRFALSGGADGYGDRVRFSWSLGPESDPDMIIGTDFVLLEGQRIKAVVGFLDKVPV
ncbi:nuclear transport factor 2 family protein [Pleomorphomonas oryzae]|uniref:nuclear transport factor 2 family protein n=1 Tax=Pleomorphomonas oryzae TaxID=261934 RepID=UPI0003F6E525|nr:nuclear transport factor 2 family protein [Pleomorphomonas oryzae]